MKKLSLLLFMLLGIVAFAQKPKYLVFKMYKGGKVIQTKYYKIPYPDTIKIVKHIPKIKRVKSKPIVVTNLEYKLVPVPTAPTALDTIAILQQYYSKNIHNETITLPENIGNIQIIDTISHNRLMSRKWTANVTPYVTEKIIEVASPKQVEWYMGPHITTNLTQLVQSFGISIVHKSIKDNIIQFQVGGNVHNGTIRPNAYFGIGGLLKLK